MHDFQNLVFTENYSGDENSPNRNCNKRERQMMKAYAPDVTSPQEKILHTQSKKQAAQGMNKHSPKKSTSSKGASRKRKRSSHFSPQSASMGVN